MLHPLPVCCAFCACFALAKLHVRLQVKPRRQLLTKGCVALQHIGKTCSVSVPRSKHKDIRSCTWPKWQAFHQKPTKMNEYLRPVGDPNATMLMGNTRI